jgi:hypothetical protein
MKKKYKMLAFSAPVPGKEDEFNNWSLNIHVPEVVSTYGFKGAQRCKLTNALAGESLPYMTIYEIETDDIAKSLTDLVQKVATPSDAIDYAGATALVYEEIGAPVQRDSTRR